MEAFSVKDLSFKYSGAEALTLRNIDLDIRSGEFLLIIGESGSGKTTLLRMLKRELRPHGELSGEIAFFGKDISELSERESASEIGFVMQDAEAQIVTDRVYSELSFGLESLGYSEKIIRARVGEFSSFFGLNGIFEKNTFELSGGQKQLLNLASSVIMAPGVIILDEPISQLDPIAAGEFLNYLKRINTELGTTVIIAEHRLDGVLSLADRVVLLERGEIAAIDTSKNICSRIDGRMKLALPVPYRAFEGFGCALTVKEGREILSGLNVKTLAEEEYKHSDNILLEVKNIWHRYSKQAPDVLKNIDFKLYSGEIYALLGDNGCGKSTLLQILCGALKPYRGKIKTNGKVAYLPQEPKAVFVHDKLADDLREINNSFSELCEEFGLTEMLDAHPYDLSGGELQKAAIVKLLLTEPDILLLDEPTKGMDAAACADFGKLLQNIKSKNKSVILVTHDLEFAAIYSDRCGLLFDGDITSESTAREFFSSNLFYTTAAAKISRGFIDAAVTVVDIRRVIGEGCP